VADIEKSNRLLPQTSIEGRLTPFHTLRYSRTTITPSETFEVKEKGETLYALGKPALSRIAALAGITFDPDKTGIQKIDRDYLVYRAVASMKLPDGTAVTAVGTAEWDYEVLRDTAKPHLDRDLRRFRIPMTETKAMHRAIRQLLGLKAKYTRAELAVPFEVPHVDYNPDISDPNVRALMSARRDVASDALYGAPALPAAPGPMDDDETDIPAGTVMQLPDEQGPTEGDSFEDAGVAEIVEDEPVPPACDSDGVVDAEPEPDTAPDSGDPADYVFATGKFAGKTLGWVENTAKEKGGNPGYSKWLTTTDKGAPDLRQACEEWLVIYGGEGTRG
jgi:hypothetical protein